MTRNLKLLGLATVAALALGALAASPASAAFGLDSFELNYEAEGGGAATKAGSHPKQVETVFVVNTKEGEPEEPDQQLRDLELTLPVGFAGAPTAVPTCSHARFLEQDPDFFESVPNCSDDTAIGLVIPAIFSPGFSGNVSLFNLDPPPGAAAEIGFVFGGLPVIIDFRVSQTPPYRVIATSTNTLQTAKIFAAKVIVWGNPASESHDEDRGHCLFLGPGSKCKAEIAEKPFVTLPRACNGPQPTTYHATSWQGSEDAGASSSSLETTGCDEIGFGPEIEAAPSTSAGESPAGLDFTMNVDDPGLTDPTGRADSDIKSVKLTLPEGVTVNPSSAEGLAACSSLQLQSETLTHQGCPEASRIGTLEAETPLLEGKVLKGSVYLAAQGDNPFGSLLALYLVVEDPQLGVLVKLPGKVEANQTTGQLVSSFDELPQLPLSQVRVHLKSGPRAPLVTPAACGKYTTQALLTPWDGGAPVTSSSSFEVNTNCGAPKPFHPGLAAGTVQSAASTYSPLLMRITRADGEEDLTRLSATLPGGIVPKLAGVSQCPNPAIAAAEAQKSGRAEQASPSCPASSLIGHIQAGAGVGQALTYVPGSLYLAGPFGGDPLSAVAIVPAVAGPFDLGNVVTRVGLTLNPVTYQGEVDGRASAPFPRILEGIPLRLRDLRVNADRPNFIQNATSCEPKAFAAQITGVVAAFSAQVPYQATGCANLGFNPKLVLKLSGGTKRGAHPALHSTVTYPYPSGPGYANIASAVVTLPPGQQIDNAHINNPCTRVQFNANQCPPNSVLGTAKATSPLLDAPLEGPVYFRSNGGERLLPDVVADLHGIVNIVLVGGVDAKNARIRTTFSSVPDAPVTKFTLDLFGGKKGLLVNNRNICKSSQKAKLVFLGQNNKLRESTPVVKNSCKGKKKGGGKGK